MCVCVDVFLINHMFTTKQALLLSTLAKFVEKKKEMGFSVGRKEPLKAHP